MLAHLSFLLMYFLLFFFWRHLALKSDDIPALCDTLMALHSSDSLAMQRFLQLLYVDDAHCQDFRYQSMLHLFDEHADPSAGSKLTPSPMLLMLLLLMKSKLRLQHAPGSIRRATNSVGTPPPAAARRQALRRLATRYPCGTFNACAAMRSDRHWHQHDWQQELRK